MILTFHLPNLYILLYWRETWDQLNHQELYLVPMFILLKKVSVTCRRIQREPSLKPMELTSHFDYVHRFTDICKDGETLEHLSFPYKPLPNDWKNRFNKWFRQISICIYILFFFFMFIFLFHSFLKIFSSLINAPCLFYRFLALFFSFISAPCLFHGFLTLFFSLISVLMKIQYRDLAIDKKDFIIPFKKG